MDKAALKQHEETYNKIIGFYDFAEQLVDTVESVSVNDPVKQLNFIEPIVEQLEEATDILAEEYRRFVQTGEKPSKASVKKVEKALAQLAAVIEECEGNI